MTCVLALDQGTTGSTALVISQGGQVLGRGYREFTQFFPQPGWVEHDPEEIWQVTLAAAREALSSVREVPQALGITNQRETIVTWERGTGRPLHRAIVWQDRRTANRCRELESRFGAEYLRSRTGLVWDPYFSATKIEWLLNEVPGLRRSAEAGDAVFGTIDSWLAYRLTDGRAFVTDHTNASRTMLYNIDTRDWDADLLGLFGVPRACLAEIRASSEVVGVAGRAHLGVEIPIGGLAGDQQAALFGQGCWEPGLAKCTYGTGAFLLLNLGARREPGRASRVLTTVACDGDGKPVYALEGSIFIAGAAVQWLRDGLGILDNAAESATMAASLPDNGGVYFVPAFVGLGAPYWEPRARGTIVGLTRGTERAHLARAALESMAYSTKDVLSEMEDVSRVRVGALKIDGGAAANDWLAQFQADLLGAPVARPSLVETTALGAAGLAGLATGVWNSAREFGRSLEYRQFLPGISREEEYAGWRRAVDATLHWTRGA